MSNVSTPVKNTDEESVKGISGKEGDNKEIFAVKTKKKSRFEPENEQTVTKRKDDKCDMFAETDTFGSNVDVRMRNCVILLYKFVITGC